MNTPTVRTRTVIPTGHPGSTELGWIHAQAEPGSTGFGVVTDPIGTGIGVEQRDRINAAIWNNAPHLPPGLVRVAVHGTDARLAPINDLALAVAALTTAVDEDPEVRESLEHTLLLGELGMDGSLRPTPGVAQAVEVARHRMPVNLIIVPEDNLDDVHAATPGCRILPAADLLETVDLMDLNLIAEPAIRAPHKPGVGRVPGRPDPATGLHTPWPTPPLRRGR